MRVLAMSSPQARGFETDFGATVGAITPSGTLALLIIGAVVGMFGGLIYLAIRGLLPRSPWLGGLVFGVVLLALSGRLLVEPNNLDFVILSSLPLAVALFGTIPVVFGIGFVRLARRVEPAIMRTRRIGLLTVLVVVGLAPMALLGGFGVLVLGIAVLVAWFGPSVTPQVRRTVRAVGACVLAGLVVWRGAVFV